MNRSPLPRSFGLGLALVAGLGVGLIDGLQPALLQDATLFSAWGAKLFSADWADALSYELVQTGPLQLLFSGLIGGIADLLGSSLGAVLSPVAQTLFLVSLVLVARSVMDPEAKRAWPLGEAGLVVVAVATGLAYAAYYWGQQADGAICLLWVLIALYTTRGKPGRAALLLGVSIALKPWGALGLPLLFLQGSIRRFPRSAAIALGTGAAFYVPFFIFGDVRMFSFDEWLVWPDSVWAWVVGTGASFTWSMRLVQAGLILVTGSMIAWRSRGKAAAIWAVPTAILALRIATDPVMWPWYWFPLKTTLLIGAVVMVRRARGRARLLLPLTALFLVAMPEQRWVSGVVLLATLLAMRWSTGASPATPRLGPSPRPALGEAA